MIFIAVNTLEHFKIVCAVLEGASSRYKPLILYYRIIGSYIPNRNLSKENNSEK